MNAAVLLRVVPVLLRVLVDQPENDVDRGGHDVIETLAHAGDVNALARMLKAILEALREVLLVGRRESQVAARDGEVDGAVHLLTADLDREALILPELVARLLGRHRSRSLEQERADVHQLGDVKVRQCGHNTNLRVGA